MSRTLTPKAREILSRASKVLESEGFNVKHILDIANAGAISRAISIEPGMEWHEVDKNSLCELVSDAFDYIED